MVINPLNTELNPICHLLALLGGATIVVVSGLRVKYIYFPITSILLISSNEKEFPSLCKYEGINMQPIFELRMNT
jgi:hypothetical protein